MMAEDRVLTADEVKFAHNTPGGDAWLREQGYGDMLDEYLKSIEQGLTWEPLDMSGTPAAPVASKLDSAGNRVSLVDVPEGEELPPYTEWSHEDLQNEAEARGLSKEGDEDTLAMRLLEDDDAADSATQKSYVGLKKAELQADCRSRGLSDEGKVDELVARLQEDDATRSE